MSNFKFIKKFIYKKIKFFKNKIINKKINTYFRNLLILIYNIYIGSIVGYLRRVYLYLQNRFIIF